MFFWSGKRGGVSARIDVQLSALRKGDIRFWLN